MALQAEMSLDARDVEIDEQDERLLALRRRGNAAEVAWVAIFLDGLLLAFGSLFWIVRGRFFDRGFYEAVSGGTWAVTAALVSPGVERVAEAGIRLAGFLGMMASIFVIAISLTGFRQGERWAWYVIWTLPAFAVLDFALVSGYRAITLTAVIWDVALLGLALIGLALSYGSLFPSAPGAAQRPSHPSPAVS